MDKTRKQRIDSTAGKIDVISKATRKFEPPSNVPLNEEALPFFTSIIAELPASEWTAHSLETAALLARQMSQLENEQRQIIWEDTVIEDAKGNKKANPRAAFITSLTSSIIALRRSLSLHARAKLGEARDAAKHRQYAKDIEDSFAEGDDELFARPH